MADKTVNKLLNPYYYLAEYHNNGLDFVGNNLTPKDISLETIINEVSKYLLTLESDIDGFSVMSEYKKIASVTWNTIENKGTRIIPDTASYLEKKFYNEFYDLINGQQSDLLINNLTDFEQRVLYSELTIEEQKYLLISINIAIGSYQYWLKQVNEYDKSPWKKFLTKESLEIKRGSLQDKDLVGAAIGGLIGGIFGAIVGGLSASIAAAVLDYT